MLFFLHAHTHSFLLTLIRCIIIWQYKNCRHTIQIIVCVLVCVCDLIRSIFLSSSHSFFIACSFLFRSHLNASQRYKMRSGICHDLSHSHSLSLSFSLHFSCDNKCERSSVTQRIREPINHAIHYFNLDCLRAALVFALASPRSSSSSLRVLTGPVWRKYSLFEIQSKIQQQTNKQTNKYNINHEKGKYRFFHPCVSVYLSV